jgi:hypothetical protein
MSIGHYREYMEEKDIMKQEGENRGHVQGLMVLVKM